MRFLRLKCPGSPRRRSGRVQVDQPDSPGAACGLPCRGCAFLGTFASNRGLFARAVGPMGEFRATQVPGVASPSLGPGSGRPAWLSRCCLRLAVPPLRFPGHFCVGLWAFRSRCGPWGEFRARQVPGFASTWVEPGSGGPPWLSRCRLRRAGPCLLFLGHFCVLLWAFAGRFWAVGCFRSTWAPWARQPRSDRVKVDRPGSPGAA